MYPMSPEYITGIAYLDEQHMQLFHLTDQAQSLLKDENMLYKFDELHTILKGLRDYSLSHFITEEAFMKNASYSKIEAHLQLHQNFIEKLSQVDAAVAGISLGTQDSILSELLDYLEEWLQQHISLEDKQMVQEIQAAE